jgi:hypothetical protein
MQRFQHEASLGLRKYNQLHHSHESQLPAQELKNLSDAAQQKQVADESPITTRMVCFVFYWLLSSCWLI